MLNFNNNTPAPPAGGQNVQWQSDASGNVSAFIGAGSGTKANVSPVAGAINLDCSLYSVFAINVNATITSMTLSGMVDGQIITIIWVQDSSGHTVVIPTTGARLLGPFSVSTGAFQHSCYQFLYNAADGNFYQVGANGM